MVMSDKEFMDGVHINIHSVRLLEKYVPTNFERKISKLVLEKFSNSCSECKLISEQIKSNPPQEKQGIFKKISNVLDST